MKRYIKIIVGASIFVLLMFAGIWNFKYQLYAYLPSENESELLNKNGILVDKDGNPFSGRVKDNSDSGFSIYTYKQGKLDGLNVVFSEGRLREIGHWKDGLQNGLFQMYTDKEILIDHANFKDGERNGLTEQFYSDTGKLRLSANYKNGVLDGVFKAYYQNGNMQAEVAYQNGEMNGKFKEYYENKNVRISGSYKKSLQNGEWKSYLEDGTLESIINYKDGMLNGLKEDFYKNGNVWTRREFKDNELDGIYEVYYEDGTIQLKSKIKNGHTIEEQRFNHDGTPYNEERTINKDDFKSSEQITINEFSDEETVLSENSKEFSEELEKGVEILGKEVGNSLSRMLEATIITNLAYVDLMSFEKIAILEENLIFNNDNKIPFKRSYKDGVYAVNIPLKNNTYLWVLLKENSEGKHRLFKDNYENFKNTEKDKKINLEVLIFKAIDGYYLENNKIQKFFDIIVTVKDHS